MSQKPMTKTQLVANLAEATGSDKVTANRALEALADIVSKEVAAGGAVTLPGLGKFQCRARPERMVRNPATGEQFMKACLLYTSPSPRDATLSRMPSSA